MVRRKEPEREKKNNPTEKQIKYKDAYLSQKWKAWDCTLLGKLKKLGCLNFIDAGKRHKALGTETKESLLRFIYEQLEYHHLENKTIKSNNKLTNSQKICVPHVIEKGLFTVIYLQIL